MSPKLPPELLDLVLEEFHPTNYRDERLAIAHCGLVCKSWLPSSRYRLFSRIYLNDYVLEPFLRVVKASPFQIPSFIRHLDLHSRREDAFLQAFLHELGGPLPLVATLCLRMNHAVLALNTAVLAQTFPMLPNLVLCYCRLSPVAVFDAAAAFPALRSLELLELEPDDDDSDQHVIPSAHRFPPQCRTLTLSGRFTEPFLEALLALRTLPVFTSLSTEGVIYPTEDSLLGKYLCRAGNGLRDLHYVRSSNSPPTALCYCTTLKSLSISFYPAGVPNVPSRILQMLPYLRSRAVALTVNMLLNTYSGAPVADDWGRLDRALSPSEFTRVQTLTFVSRVREIVELPRYMPLAAARGVLTVVLEKAR
ncbi:hypothetical protein C8R44DRAFT_139700 [Mycena epipterygia]|nr:hypothetical protein C8R44DRAFT_139700 [Mycena epipterygia]